MNLEKYLKESGRSQGDFGRRLTPPASQGLVSQWVRGVTRVTLDYALQIERESGGTVTPQECADMFVGADGRADAPPTRKNVMEASISTPPLYEKKDTP